MTRHSAGDPYSHPIARIYESTSFLSSLHGILLQGERGVISPTIALSEAFRLSLGSYSFKGWCNQASQGVFVGRYLAVALLRGITHTLNIFYVPSDLRHLENLFQQSILPPEIHKKFPSPLFHQF